MLRKIETALLSVVACFALAAAAQLQSLKIVPDTSASAVRAQGDVVSVEWVQLSGVGSQTPVPEPLDGDVYYAAAPAGGNLAKYTKLTPAAVANGTASFSGGIKKRVTNFVPNGQGGRMGPGAYYLIVASVSGGDTLYSDYFNLMVASPDLPAIVAPKADFTKGEREKIVTDLAPVFTWKSVPGVPYYHILLFDRPFINSATNDVDTNANVIWQAITPDTRIAYGAPDPSNTINAAPPPLSQGIIYSWMVLNNYGNRPAFTSWKVDPMDGIASRFIINTGGGKLTAPSILSPRNASFSGAAKITFEWDNLDVNASSYLVNLLRVVNPKEVDMSGMDKFRMGVLAWETVVQRGDRRGGDKLSVTLDAAGALDSGSYKWRVYALDNRGAASTDTVSASAFEYKKSGEVDLTVKTFERIGGVDVPVTYVGLTLDVVSGPTVAPLFFYTNGKGVVKRRFSTGTYRISTAKEGYPAYVSTITVRGADTLNINMSRSEALLHGRVLLAADNSAVSAAKVTAVSEWGDTVSAATDGGGGFVLACQAADWTVSAEKSGFRASSSGKVTLRPGDYRNFGDIYLVRSPFTLSGVVRNLAGEPVVGALVRVWREGVLTDELASTPQNGSYAFYLDAGTYAVTAEKPGFAMFGRSVVVAGNVAQNITLKEGAVLVSGVITGRSWVAGAGGFVFAPITSARVTFAEIGAAGSDTFTVASDAVFGKFSVSLPKDKNYNVTASAAGFAAGAARRFATSDAGSDLSKAYADTLVALASIRGRVTGADGVLVDVIVLDAQNRIVASAKSVGGEYEVRNIPNGSFTVTAGATGYFTRPRLITVTMGKPETDGENYDFSMEAGNKSVRFEVEGYARGGAVKVVSPLNITLPLDSVDGALLSGVGAGEYVAEAVPAAADSNLLELSYHRFEVPGNVSEHTEALSFPFRHTADAAVNLVDGKVKINWPTSAVALMKRIELFYRSEGSVRFESVSANVSVAARPEFDITPARDGCNLYYYFRVYLENANGDIYGSSKRLYRSYVNPDDKVISRVTVEPGAAGGDTLFIPASYTVEFAFRAFYSDQFTPISGNAGTATWSVLDSTGQFSVIPPGIKGAKYSYTAPDIERNLILRVSFAPLGGYTMKAGVSNAVEFPVRVTGKGLRSISVLRKGGEGPILNTENAAFRVQAVDADGRPVTVSPRWSVYPGGAGAIGDAGDSAGLFKPRSDFVGMARITADVGELTAEYTEQDAAVPGQLVNYALKPNPTGSQTADTKRRMRVIFDRGAVPEGVNAKLEVTVPKLTNLVHVGTENYRMADTTAFNLSIIGDVRAVRGKVFLAFDIPPLLRDAAKGGGYEFRVARWLPDSLRWVPVEKCNTCDAEAGVVFAELSPKALYKSGKSAAREVDTLAASGRYALVVKTSKTLLTMSVSPNPFSPYIVPKKEYAQNKDTTGTCIKVNVQAPGSFVKSVKVRVHNTTGKMVWGIDKLGASTGEHRFWWNGRTSGNGGAISEMVWLEDYYNSNKNRPLCRNGRYYVMVIVTDMEGKQRRAVKPLVLMK